MTGIVIIIPARYRSTRFEGKPLVPICGRPMIQHVYERARRSEIADRVIVATDDKRIFDAVAGFGGDAVMTSSLHRTGTDRLVEVSEKLSSRWVINLQGDEPLIEPKVIDLLGKKMMAYPEDDMFSLMRPISEKGEFFDPNVVKVVTDNMGYALYFSRAPIPFPKALLPCISDLSKAESLEEDAFKDVFIHCGIYGYKRDFLLSIPSLTPSALEKTEGLEQLRILTNGHKIRMIPTEYFSIGVDTPETVKTVEDFMEMQ